MKKSGLIKILKISFLTFLFLTAVLVVHIYWVTRPRVDKNTRIMARIDIHQSISKSDAGKITAWLYRQQGVDHVLVNPGTEIAVFTFSPMIANGNDIASRFAADFNYPYAKRFIPTASQLQGSCPMTSSFTYKVSSYLKKFF